MQVLPADRMEGQRHATHAEHEKSPATTRGRVAIGAKIEEKRLDQVDSQSAQPTRVMTRSSAFGPGYLGLTSHATIFREARDSLSAQDYMDSEPVGGNTEEFQVGAGFRDLPLPVRQMCLFVLECLPGQRDTLMVYRGGHYPAKSWTHAAVERIVPSLRHLVEFHAECDTPLEKVADVLCRNTAQPMLDTIASPKEWMDQFCGSNLRWESLGLLWAHLEGLSDALGALEYRQLQWAPGRESTHLSLLHLGYCIELSRNFTGGNDLLVDLCRRHSTLGTMIHGDAGISSWTSHSLSMSMMTFLGIHAPGDATKPQGLEDGICAPSFCVENKRRLFAFLFYTDKSDVSFSGRPPLISRRYCSSALPLDLQDEALTADEATLTAAAKNLDSRGWNTQGRIYPATIIRARTMIAYVLDEIMEIALGNDTHVTVGYLHTIKARQIQTVSGFPTALLYDAQDLADPSLDTDILYARILVHLAHLGNMFFIERLLLRHGAVDEGNLLSTSFDLVKVTVMLWIHKDRFARMRRNFEWLLMAFAAPGGGILCQELLRPTFYGVHPLNSNLSRSSIIQQLSFLVAFLNWMGPNAPNGSLCSNCETIVQRVLDQHLNNVAANSSIEPLASIVPHPLGFQFELLNTFDWLHNGL
ncbi:hypothetical protein FZEAL_3292 [Fusarium zealandicum]|uniref:Xylanolytic transcriptional activator regulatory domain-containing protein n=1 Tax=Fusarium zealandicum TaxID=1053134 RepID=A0A8H4XMQ5_9HYPO|nr:hypothetical protein FZEAL_3292 [Fusarium zealandicum]